MARIERGWFVLNGITFDTPQYMEPSFAKLFAAHGLDDETKETPALKNARAAFRERHEGHGEWILDAIEVALKRITKRNPDLLLAYYEYYADHKLTDESHWYDHIAFDPDKNTGATAYGDTVIHPDVLRLRSRFKTDDAISLLAETLIHEYVHTPQGGGADPVSAAPLEAKAYGIELFFSERMGDEARAGVIRHMKWDIDSTNVRTGAAKVFSKAYAAMTALYKIMDQGGAGAKEAREMSVEFISKNSDDFGGKLNAFLAKVR